MEGIGYDFVPRTCARECIDAWYKTEDVSSLTYARRLIRTEGLLVGGSAGAVVDAALKFIKEKGWENDKSKRVVLVFSDSIRTDWATCRAFRLLDSPAFFRRRN